MASNGKGSAKGKGKAVASKGSSGKRKREDDKTRSGRKKTNPAVLQFFEDSAAEASDYDTSDFEEDFPDDDEDDEELTKPGEPQKSQKAPVKEEELSGDELERVLEERYKSGSGYVRYAEDDYETKRVDKNFGVPSAPEPVIWKVKCKIGRERQTIFCLMQKFADLKALGTRLQIVSAFSVEHVRGFIFVEANKQFEVMEACKQLPDVYYSMITHVPSSEFSQMLAVRKKKTEVSKGMWVRVKSGNYKGDLAQVVAVGDSRKKATLKLIPRVDFQALAAKFGAGSSIKRTAVPKPRLIASSDLEEFRPLIQSRRDRDTGMIFEVLDGLMLKDGYLYKKVPVDSLRICDVNPSIEELQKFRVSNNEDSSNVEFLSQLYGDKKEIPTLKPVQVGGKGEGTSGSKEQEDIQVHDLVLFGKREFGMVIGMEKDESYKILKYGLEGSVVVSLSKKDLKNLNLEKKFNALDHRMKTIFANDVVKLLDGPLKDKEGVVKQIYRGIIFLYDQNDMEDNAYFCAKSQSCEKVKHNDDICLGKNGEAGPSGCEDLPSSPKTPLSPEKPWQTEEQSRNFNRREQQDGEFSVGQSLRIRVGPLKGYLCRVLAVRRSDVTVKLDSRQKVLTVKSEHLSEVRGKSFATSTCDDTGLDSSRPFDFLGNNAGGNDWMAGSVQNNEKNEEGQSTEGSSWPAFTSSAPSQPWGASSGDTSAPTEDDPWQKKPNTTLEGGLGWGTEVKMDIPSVPQNDTNSSWDKGKNVTDGTSSWGNVSGGSSWSQEVKTDIPSIPQQDTSSSWDKGKNVIGGTSSWGNLAPEKDNEPSGSSGWGQQKSTLTIGSDSQNSWGQPKNSQDKGTNPTEDSWGKAAGETWGSKADPIGTKDWTNPAPAADSQNGGWGAGGASNQADASNWGKPKSSSEGPSWGKSSNVNPQDKGTNPMEDSWGKAAGETWGSKADPIGTKDWTNPAPAADSQNGGWGAGGASNQADASNWGKPKSSSEGPSWGKSDLKQQDGSTQNEGWNVGGGSGERSSEPAVGWNSASSGWGQQKPSDASGVKSGGWGDSSGKWGAQKEDNAPSWNSSGNDSWGNNQGRGGGRGDYGGRGGDFGGRRGRGGFRGGRDQPGRGRGGRQSWNNEGEDKPSWGGSSGGGWGNNNQGGGGGGSGGWAKEKSGGGSWGNDKCGSAGGGWGTSGGTSNQGGGGGWGNNDKGGSVGGSWGTSGGTSNQGGNGGGGGWAKESGGGGGGGGNNDKGGSDGGGKWGAQKDDNAPSWNSSGNDSWGNNQGRGGGRGDYGGRGGDFGGRRGRGGFRGGRDQPGRGRGGRQSWNNEGEDKPAWGGSSGGGWGNNNQGGGGGGWAKEKSGGGSWGNDKGGSAGGGGWAKESGGGGGGWGNNDKGGGSGGGGWGASGISKQGGNGGGGDSGGGWAKDGGSSWGTSGVTNGGGGGTGWGSSSSGKASNGGWGGSSAGTKGDEVGAGGEEKATGAGGWGSSSSGKASTGGWGGSSTKGDEGGGSGWGSTKVADAGSSGGWGKPPSGQSGAGREEKATGAGGWGGSEGAAGSSSGGWGNSSSGKSEAGGGEKATGGGGWGGGNKDQGGGGW